MQFWKQRTNDDVTFGIRTRSPAAMAALVDVQFALPALAKLPSAGLDKETVDTCITLASLESPLVQAAAEALSAKGMPFAWDTDPAHAAVCAKLVKEAVAAAAAEVRNCYSRARCVAALR